MQRALIKSIIGSMAAALLLLGLVGCSHPAIESLPNKRKSMDTQDIPMREMGKVPTTPPELTLNGVEVDRYTLDWQMREKREVYSGNGVAPTGSFALKDEIRMRFSAPETPLSLELMIYEGSPETINPTSRPTVTIDCKSQNSGCEFSKKDTSLELRLSTRNFPERGVISIFAEYFRSAELSNDSGSTNFSGWVFCYSL